MLEIGSAFTIRTRESGLIGIVKADPDFVYVCASIRPDLASSLPLTFALSLIFSAWTNHLQTTLGKIFLNALTVLIQVRVHSYTQLKMGHISPHRFLPIENLSATLRIFHPFPGKKMKKPHRGKWGSNRRPFFQDKGDYSFLCPSLCGACKLLITIVLCHYIPTNDLYCRKPDLPCMFSCLEPDFPWFVRVFLGFCFIVSPQNPSSLSLN
jgi:hypothetical protein